MLCIWGLFRLTIEGLIVYRKPQRKVTTTNNNNNNNNNNGICSGISTRWLFIHCFQIELEFRSVGFLMRGENRSTRRKTSRSRVENQQQTQPTYDAESGNRTRDTLVGGERSHHCANPAPLNLYIIKQFKSGA